MVTKTVKYVIGVIGLLILISGWMLVNRSRLEWRLREMESRLEERTAPKDDPKPTDPVATDDPATPEDRVVIEDDVLIRDLMERESRIIGDVIGAEPVLGGRMGFYVEDNIQILNDRWVFVRFEDGHIQGEAILTYRVATDDSIQWELIASSLPF